MSDEAKPLFLSSVEGHTVSRFGTRALLVGANRTSSGTVWDPKRVDLIPAQEATFYRREYARLIRAGALVTRTKEEFEAYHAAEAAKALKAAEAPESAPEVELEPEPSTEASTEPPTPTSIEG